MSALRALSALSLASLAAACGGGDSAPAGTPDFPASTLPALSTATPFPAGCDGSSSGGVYLDAEVEPQLAVDPADPLHLIASWQQDRWHSDGGSHGLRAAVSFDGGQSWALRQAALSRCAGAAGGSAGDYERSTDPWIAIAPDGTAYWTSLSFDASDGRNAILLSRSTDGGDHWDGPVALKADTSSSYQNDKNAIAADPGDANRVYVTWDRLDFSSPSGASFGPAWFTRTADAGATWESARPIYDPGANNQTIGNTPVVLPDGTVVVLMSELDNSPLQGFLEVTRSTDHGATWSAPVEVAELLTIGATDPQTGARVRDGSDLGSIAVGADGTLYVAWQDSRFSSGVRDGIALTTSTDGGLTWSTPVQVNANAATQAFTPTVAVTAAGTIGVTYYDFRDDTPAAGTLLTGYWLVTSDDGTTWTERRIDGPFDLDVAPRTVQGWFVGDYQGLAAAGTDFRAVFSRTNPSLGNRTDIYTTTLSATALAKAGASRFGARSAPPVQMTPAWRGRVQDQVRRAMHQVPGAATPTTRKQ